MRDGGKVLFLFITYLEIMGHEFKYKQLKEYVIQKALRMFKTAFLDKGGDFASNPYALSLPLSGKIIHCQRGA